MDVNKNSYTFIFATIMVVVVALILSIAATSLQPRQAENQELESMQNILKSIDVQVSRDEARDAYEKYIKEELVIKNGEETDEVDAFEVKMADEMKKSFEERYNPLYIAEKDGETFYIIPLRGRGLWGPLWGYIALKEDVATIYGANFDHKSETPGLGAEISTSSFYDQFKDKRILDEEGNFKSVEVKKGSASGDHQVDGISGGTITSNGVSDMLRDCIVNYVDYLKARSPKHDEELPVEDMEAPEELEEELEEEENA